VKEDFFSGLFLDFSAGSTADRENKAVFCEKESVAA
jgi:hypothetical protein